MKGKLVFLAGAAAGYVLGAQAGRKRYEQIKSGAEKLWNSPTVKKGVEQVQTFVDDHASDVPSIVGNSAKKVVGSVAKRTGKGSSESSGTGASSGNGASSGTGSSTGTGNGQPTAAAGTSLPDSE